MGIGTKTADQDFRVGMASQFLERRGSGANKLVHGRETREARSERILASARLAVLEAVGHKLGSMNGTRTSGRKPYGMADAYPELKALVKVYV